MASTVAHNTFNPTTSSQQVPDTALTLLQPSIHSPNLILTSFTTPNLSTLPPSSHLIRVYTTSPCAGELTWAANFPSLVPSTKPQIPCYDLAGIVVSAPPGSKFPAGTKVWTRTSAERSGNAREYSVALEAELARIPEGLGWDEAASMPLSALTAWQALFDKGGLVAPGGEDVDLKKNGKNSVLIDAASGGVGVLLVQIAKAAGVGRVIGVCSTGNVDLVKGLGADEVLDYRKIGIEEYFASGSGRKKVDLAIDLLGGKSLESCWRVVGKGGRVVSVREPPDGRKPETGIEDGVQGSFFVMEPLGWQLELFGRLVVEGKIRAVVDSVWKLEEYEKAFERVESGHAKGKLWVSAAELDESGWAALAYA
ncbi:zinc-binding oxidoreductase protein [Rutstroemia sp. NJR-2017a WRK4]|nr:zinc-binding oxidoreductase protein [Rutstroemia sp. NJR-2017a WRK4]